MDNNFGKKLVVKKEDTNFKNIDDTKNIRCKPALRVK